MPLFIYKRKAITYIYKILLKAMFFNIFYLCKHSPTPDTTRIMFDVPSFPYLSHSQFKCSQNPNK